MMNRTNHSAQIGNMQKPNRLLASHLPLQQQQQPHQQFMNNQRNISVVENTALVPTTTPTNSLNYLQNQQLMCPNLNPQSQLQPQQASLHSHSLVSTVNNTHLPSLGTSSNNIYDPHVSGLYTTGATAVSQVNGSTNFIDHGLNGMSNIPNTILINNFTQQIQPETSQRLYQQHSLHSTTQQFQHHLPTNIQIQHNSSAAPHQSQLQSQSHALQQRQPFFSQPHIAGTSTSSQTMQMHLPTTQPFYVSKDTFNTGTSSKMPTYMPPIVNSTLATNLNDMQKSQQQLQLNSIGPTTASIASTNSPVVLDRINICINNHYSDSGIVSNTVRPGTPGVLMPADTPPLPSPIIPPIQHSGVIDPGLLVESLTSSCEVSSNNCALTPVPPVISEPDSTTTSNTPPTTPENANPTSSLSTIQSPSTSSTASDAEVPENRICSTENLNKIKSTECESLVKTSEIGNCTDKEKTVVSTETDVPTTPTALHRLEEQPDITPIVSFIIGEDVFVKKEDDRLYLGTVIDSKYQKYRVRFDDKSEVWCSSKEMRKFGNFGETMVSPGETCNDDSDSGILCVACKIRDHVGVEICERCGRGYHHKCTTETSPESGIWLCKRCDKPMKLDPSEVEDDSELSPTQFQLPYDINSLTWDSKHRVNQEQIYCYCGKSGQFDQNMLQCCKCLNWFHTACVQNFEGQMLRGDGNFVFCCSICSTDGKEFLRRVQTNEVDFVHLALYNLSAQKKHQQHKYHHLTKDIWPFVLAQRHTDAFPVEWQFLSEDALKDRIISTLKENVDRFVCGREVKRDCYYYGLRHNGPPMPLKINVQKEDVLSDLFLRKLLRLKLVKQESKYLNPSGYTNLREGPKGSSFAQEDIYEFHSDKEDVDDDDEKFTSDDEIPIKHILEKEKRNKKPDTKEQGSILRLKPSTATVEKDCQLSHLEDLRKSDDKIGKNNEKRNHKRKAFTLSKPYKETAAAAAAKRYHSVRNCDSSSDENSSSSRGTSLDLIIPPPKDFLGLNNPFRNVTPKKNGEKKSVPFARNNPGGPAIKNSIVNTSSLDFGSKLAALKSAGIFPNLNATSLAKAAGQPRMVRTIKRRLSAKDIMIGPNQEVRRRRTRRLSANVEVISTTTINPLPTNLFPMNAKDLFNSGCAVNTTLRKQNIQGTSNQPASSSSSLAHSTSNSSTSSLLLHEQFATIVKTDEPLLSTTKPATHGRRLRARIQKPLTNNSRRSSLSGVSTSSSSSSCANVPTTVSYPEHSVTYNDLQQSVNKYFGAGNRIMAGDKFSVYAKRQLPSGQVQYLIEWGSENGNANVADSTTNTEQCDPNEPSETPLTE